MRKLSLPDKAFGNLLKFILDENITDINWSQGLWVNDLNKGRYKIKGFTLDDNFIQQFYTRISNLMNVQFNKNNPLLEAETDNLRISILHDSVTKTAFRLGGRIRQTSNISLYPPLLSLFFLSMQTVTFLSLRSLHVLKHL